MKAIVKPYHKVGLELASNLAVPKIRERDILVHVLAASVCGTDLHIYDSDPTIRERVADRQIIGHEFCGEVIEVGKQVTTLSPGDIVSSESHIVCGTCYYCLNGMSHLCQEVSLVGVDRPGGLAEYVLIPAENGILKPENISVEEASFMDAYGNAVDTALCVPLVGNSVLITGCGPQGLMAIAIASAAGAKQIIATETSKVRRDMAAQILQTHINPNQDRRDLILEASDATVVGKIFDATNGLGVDVLLEMSGHPTAIRDGFTVLKNGANAVILGLPSGPISLDWGSLVFKGVKVWFRYGRLLYRTWFEGRGLLDSGAVKLKSLITHHFELEEFDEGFQVLKRGEGGKIILYPDREFTNEWKRRHTGDKVELA